MALSTVKAAPPVTTVTTVTDLPPPLSLGNEVTRIEYQESHGEAPHKKVCDGLVTVVTVVTVVTGVHRGYASRYQPLPELLTLLPKPFFP
jgi:hypothetical protein